MVEEGGDSSDPDAVHRKRLPARPVGEPTPDAVGVGRRRGRHGPARDDVQHSGAVATVMPEMLTILRSVAAKLAGVVSGHVPGKELCERRETVKSRKPGNESGFRDIGREPNGFEWRVRINRGIGFENAAYETREEMKSKGESSQVPHAPIADKIKLGEPGYKERYYKEKFGVSEPEEIDKVRKDVAEERVRNSILLDLLYVHPSHPLAPQIASYYQFYFQLPPEQRYAWPIDVNASDGMNGYLWLCERNGWRSVVPSPINDLQDIANNQALNVTYLNPSPHKHIPEPPKGVIMPAKEIKPTDVKPFPMLWHEENGRGHRERPQVPGSIGGPQLGEAAHRLLKNTLNIKNRDSHPGFSEHMQRGNSPSNNYFSPRPRPAGPMGYERGYHEDPNQYKRQYGPRGMLNGPRHAHYDPRNERPNNYHNLTASMNTLGLEEPRTRSHHRPRAPNGSFYTNQPNHNALPSPPVKWVNRGPGGSGGMPYRHHQETSSVQVKHVYQVKTRGQQDTSGDGVEGRS